jgi:hypothetical protein
MAKSKYFDLVALVAMVAVVALVIIAYGQPGRSSNIAGAARAQAINALPVFHPGYSDLAVTSIFVVPEEPNVNETTHLMTTVKNLGIRGAYFYYSTTLQGPQGGGSSGGSEQYYLGPGGQWNHNASFDLDREGNYSYTFSVTPVNTSFERNFNNNYMTVQFYVSG